MGNINGFEIPGGLLDYKGLDATQSVSSTLVLMDSISVPAGTFKSNDVFLIQSLITRDVTTLGTITHYIYWNTNAFNFSGAVLLATSQGPTVLVPSSAVEYVPLYRTVCVVDSTTTLVYNTSSGNYSTDLGDTSGNQLTNAISTITSINWNIDGFLIVAAADTTTQTLTKRYFTILR
jgi:hypothetical protein